MATFDELLDMYANPPEDGLPQDFATQLKAEYDKGIQDYTESAASALERATAAEERATLAEAAKLQAQQHNARLLKSIPAHSDEDDGPNGDNNQDGDMFEKPATINDYIEYL